MNTHTDPSTSDHDDQGVTASAAKPDGLPVGPPEGAPPGPPEGVPPGPPDDVPPGPPEGVPPGPPVDVPRRRVTPSRPFGG